MNAMSTLTGLTAGQAALFKQAKPPINRLLASLWARRRITPSAVMIIVADVRSGLGWAYGRMRWPHGALVRRAARQVATGRLPVVVVPLWGSIRADFLARLLPTEVEFVAGRPPGTAVLLVVDRDSHGVIAFIGREASARQPN